MRNIVLTISYDGTNFSGWQRQAGDRTVQEEIEKALAVVHKKDITLHGSGRTDSGVHAIGQIAHFSSPIDTIPLDRYPSAINASLPFDIRIHSAQEKDMEFHARFSAVNRTYRYFFHIENTPPFAHNSSYVWWIRHKPNIKNLNEMAKCLHGEVDCASFTAAGDKSKSTVRYIEKAHFFLDNDVLVFEICANAFLWKMVRTLVGTFIDLDIKGYSHKEFNEIICAKNRNAASATAPSRGLFLWHINFDGERKHP